MHSFTPNATHAKQRGRLEMSSTEQRWSLLTHSLTLSNCSHHCLQQNHPSAVLIDEAGRVASEVGVGTPDVLARVRSAPAVSA